jgi:hypothetical protein
VKQFVDLKRLADEVARAAFNRVDRIFHRPVPGDHDRDDVWIPFDGRFDDGGTVDAGQTQIGDDHVEREICELCDGGFTRSCLLDDVTAIGELLGNRRTQRALVLDQKKMSCLFSHLRGRQDFDTG